MAPRPSDTWSVRVSPIDGSVTVPTMVSVRLFRPLPTVTVSPIRLPSWRRVATPSSIWRGPAIGWPLVVGGSTEPRCRVSPRTGRLWPSMGIWVNAKVDQPVTPGWPLTSRFICAGGPALVPALAVHQQRPVPAVSGRVGDQPGQAGAEHHRDRDGHDRHHRAGQGGQHGNRPAPRSPLQRLPGPHHGAHRQARRGGGRGDRRCPGGRDAAGGPDRPPGQHAQDGEQGGGEHAAAARQHQRIRLHAPGRVELPDRAHRGERGDRDRAHHRQCRAAEDRDRSRQPGSECRLGAGRRRWRAAPPGRAWTGPAAAPRPGPPARAAPALPARRARPARLPVARSPAAPRGERCPGGGC